MGTLPENPKQGRALPRLTPDQVWQTITDGLLVLSPGWEIRFVNTAAEDALVGYAERLVGRNYWEAFPHLVGTDWERKFRRSMLEAKALDFDFHAGREGRWYRIRTFPSPLGLTVSFSDITDRKQGELTHALTRDRFRVAAAVPWLTLYEQDTDLRYIWLYPSHPDHKGALGRTDAELFPDGSLAELIAAKRKVMAMRQPMQVEAAVKKGDSVIWYDTYICPRLNSAGEVIGVTGAGLDVTDRKRAELALRENQERLRATYANAPIGIAEADLDGRLISMNERYARQLGYRAEEMLGRSFGDFLHPDDRQESWRDYQDLLSGAGGTAARERRYLHKDGRIIWVSVARSLVRDPQGVPKFAMAVTNDISDRKLTSLHQQLLYRLVASVNRAATAVEIYDAALDALCQSQECSRGSILLCDEDGVMRFVAWRGLSEGYRCAVEGHSPWSRDDPDPQPVCIANVAACELDEHLRTVVQAEQIAALAFIPLTFEGRLLGKFMVYFDQPHAFTTEKLQMAETIARQVSFAIERRQAAARLETLVRHRTTSLREAIQQMEEFSYTVSHDLRAPIRGMATYATAILEDHGARLDAEVVAYLQRILRNAGRMDALVRDTLAYSRVARGELKLSAVSLDEAAAIAVAEAAPAGTVSVTGPLGLAVAHEPLLVQVFSNLLANAVKFVPAGASPKVAIRAEQREGVVRVLVQDNGIGIAPELQARLFAIFERLHTSAEYEGTGIGLAIVRKAVERMGGRVGVESDGTQGSTFWFELPTADEFTVEAKAT